MPANVETDAKHATALREHFQAQANSPDVQAGKLPKLPHQNTPTGKHLSAAAPGGRTRLGPNAVNLRAPGSDGPEGDDRAGWERLPVVGLQAGEASGLFLLAGEAALAAGCGEQVAGVGDLVDDVVDEVDEVTGGKRPRRRRGDGRLPAWCG
jgi:hypothetical protein